MRQQNTKNEILKLADKFFPKIVSIRRKIHQYPELAFEEHRTSKLIAETLRSLGIRTRTGVAKTGVVGILKGKAKNLKGKYKVIALRADMDALPIQEKTGVDFASKVPGKMHACGHDAHIAIVLGSAMILNELRDKFNGVVKFIFQPSEEKNPGGAKFMIKEGVLKNPKVDMIFGLHVKPDSEAGTIFLKEGPLMASSDEIYITVKGKGGHGAKPHRTIDPIAISAELILALQKVVSRFFDPTEPRVLTIGKIEGGSAPNVIPDEVRIEGTLRTMNETWRKKAWEMINQVLRGITSSYGADYKLEIRKGYPVLVNHREAVEFAREKAVELFGKRKVSNANMVMGAEDFAYYLEKVPGCFIWLGAGDERQRYDIHSPKMTIKEEAMKVGASLLAYLTISALT